MHYVIIGNSAAGIFAAETIRGLDPAGKITMISKENNIPYSRCLTSYYIGKEIDEDRIYIRNPNFYVETGIEFIAQNVEQVDDQKKCIILQSGEVIHYDKLLIATGSSPAMLPIEGRELEGVFQLRTLEDARKIIDYSPKVKEAVVNGAGLVGLKGAHALHQLGIKVTIVVNSRIMSRSIDATTGSMITEFLERDGYQVIYNHKLTKILGENKVEGILLNSGKEIPCQMVLEAAGVRPNTSLVLKSGVKVNKGIIVDQQMQTSVQDIYAAGDVVETYDLVWKDNRINALWPHATAQGIIAGSNMAGAERYYDGSIGLNSVSFSGVGVVSAGMIDVPKGEGKILSFSDNASCYRKFIMKEDRLVGMILVGDIEGAGILTSLIRKRAKVDLDILTQWLTSPVRYQGYFPTESRVAKGGISYGIC